MSVRCERHAKSRKHEPCTDCVPEDLFGIGKQTQPMSNVCMSIGEYEELLVSKSFKLPSD